MFKWLYFVDYAGRDSVSNYFFLIEQYENHVKLCFNIK